MKKLLVAVLCIGFSYAVSAQASVKPAMKKSYQGQDILTQNGVAMKSGKVVMMKNGQAGTALTKEIKLANGMIVSPGGLVTKGDGSTASLKEGDYIMMSGSTNNRLTWKSRVVPAKVKSDTLK